MYSEVTKQSFGKIKTKKVSFALWKCMTKLADSNYDFFPPCITRSYSRAKPPGNSSLPPAKSSEYEPTDYCSARRTRVVLQCWMKHWHYTGTATLTLSNKKIGSKCLGTDTVAVSHFAELQLTDLLHFSPSYPKTVPLSQI